MKSADLIRHAAIAEEDAARWVKQPNGQGLARLRREDARALRRLAALLDKAAAPVA